MRDREPPPVHSVQVGPRCKCCGDALVGEHTHYVYVRQLKRLTSGHAIADTCLGCVGDMMLEDPKFMAKLMAKFFNHPAVADKLAEILLAGLDKVEAKRKPPGE